MSSEKPNFLSQPVVKNIFMFRNGDPYYDARRIVINQKRVCNFETLLREVTGGIQAPFGAVRNIYTPRGGHKVECLESLQSGEQYVAAGRERFKKLDYLQIGSRKKRLLQTLPVQAKPLPQHRIIVSARFLKPIKEPCPIFVVANGDVLNPALRVLIHQRMLGQFDRILEMITGKMGLRVLGGVRSLYTYEGHQVTDGNQLESGQLYVAVGRERFKKLPYSDLLFTKPRGTRRVNGMKAYSLPPIYRFSKQNGNSKSMVRCSDSGDGESKGSHPGHSGNNKEHLSSIVREISQARLISLRKKRSGQSMTLGISDNSNTEANRSIWIDDLESKADDGNAEKKSPQDESTEEKPAAVDTKASEENDEKAEEKEETSAENTTEEETSASKEEMKENEEPSSQIEEETKANVETSSQIEGEETKENEEPSSQIEEETKANLETSSQIEGEETKENVETSSQIEEETKNNEETSSQIVGEETKENVETSSQIEEETKENVVTSNQIEGEETKNNEETNNEKEGEATAGLEEKEEEQCSSSSNNDKTQDRKETEDGNHSSSEGEKDEQDKTVEEETQDKDSGKEEESSKDPVNDVDTGEEQKEKENSNDPGKTQSDNETKENDNDRSSSSNSNHEENVSKTKEDATKESGEEERQVNGEVSGEEDEVENEAENQDKSRKVED